MAAPDDPRVIAGAWGLCEHTSLGDCPCKRLPKPRPCLWCMERAETVVATIDKLTRQYSEELGVPPAPDAPDPLGR